MFMGIVTFAPINPTTGERPFIEVLIKARAETGSFLIVKKVGKPTFLVGVLCML